MNTSQVKIPKWVVTVLILIFIGFGIYAIILLTSKKTGEEGCFSFNDGTLQGWTLDQLYDIDLIKAKNLENERHKIQQLKIPYEPFKLSYNEGEIKAYTSTYQVPDSTFEHCVFYFVSPDLSDDPNWQNIAGFRYDITKEFTCSSGDWYSYRVFGEIIAENESGDEVILFEKASPTTKSFMTIHNFGVPYYYGCKPFELRTSNSTYTIKQIRIGCIIIGYNFNPNVQFSGGWKLTNVCPVY